MKKYCSLVLVFVFLLNAMSAACAEESRIFKDSTGRDVQIPAVITRVAVTGPLTQYPVFAIAPERLVAVSMDWDDTGYIADEYLALPNIGQLYGGKGEMNLEGLLAAAPEVVIDMGEAKGSTAQDLDQLEQQTGIPFIHIDASISTFDNAFLMLGSLLGKEEEAKALAEYCASAYQRALEISGKTEKARILYITGSEGLHVIAAGSYQGEIIDMLTDNLAKVDNPTSKGTGNEVDLEQIMNWDPDHIVFSPDSIFETVSADELWQNVTAIREGAYVEVPSGPQNWMGFPPGCQRMLGMLWLAKVFYPDTADYDLYDEAAAYYRLFYHCDLTRETYDKLVQNSIGKQAK